jgi:CheY-like chemotaxis protein
LPIEGLESARSEEGPSQAAAEAKTYQTVLTVDDDERVIRLFRRYLEPRGYRVFGLTDPKRVVEEAKRLKPYAITLDIIMPQDKDGWSLIQELKADSQTRDIPIIVCSILSEADKGLSMGIADYLVKPITEQDLLEALARLEKGLDGGHILLVDDNPDDFNWGPPLPMDIYLSDTEILHDVICEVRKEREPHALRIIGNSQNTSEIKTEKIRLEIGKRNENNIEIISGLSEGERVKVPELSRKDLFMWED